MANTPAPLDMTDYWNQYSRGADSQQPFGVQLMGSAAAPSMSPHQFQTMTGTKAPKTAPIGMDPSQARNLMALRKPIQPIQPAPVTAAPPPPSLSNVPANPTATGQATHQEIQGLTLEQWRNIQRMLGMAPSV